MKHEPMTQQSRKAVSTGPRKGKADAAFDLWLQRGLHKLFDDVAREPIPDELLRLIEDDREKRGGPETESGG
jgi:hypothetical protein